ncbi:MAG: PTS sugar transporter subunit IIA [Deltaproteobacteria bacterium]|nr:PTS sugar transporter subunit IIA [Deltaproteobacteria bacterium]
MLLTVREAAAMLGATERQVYRWVEEGELPHRRVLEQVRFSRTDLLEWGTAHGRPLSPALFLGRQDLAAALARGGVHHAVPAADREEALARVVARTPMPPGVDREFILEVLVAREATGSTAIGEGLALPHVRQPMVVPGAAATVSVSHLRTPVPFGAPDGVPVRTIFLLVTPTVRAHLQLLALLARALQDRGFRRAIERGAPTDELVAEAARVEVAPGPEAASEGPRPR